MFSYWLRKYLLWFKSISFFNHWLEPTFLLWFKTEGAQLFPIWVTFWILIWKLSWVLRGKIDVSLENAFWLPKSARSAQTVENSHSFINVSYTWYKSLMVPKPKQMSSPIAWKKTFPKEFLCKWIARAAIAREHFQ